MGVRLGCMVLWESRYQGAWHCGSRNWGAWYFIEVAEIGVHSIMEPGICVQFRGQSSGFRSRDGACSRESLPQKCTLRSSDM